MVASLVVLFDSLYLALTELRHGRPHRGGRSSARETQWREALRLLQQREVEMSYEGESMACLFVHAACCSRCDDHLTRVVEVDMLALDEDTPTTRLQGATQPQINRLPTYKYTYVLAVIVAGSLDAHLRLVAPPPPPPGKAQTVSKVKMRVRVEYVWVHLSMVTHCASCHVSTGSTSSA